MGFLKQICRALLQAGLDALGPEPGAQVHVKRVEVSIRRHDAAGQIARDVAKELIEMRRYRESSLAAPETRMDRVRRIAQEWSDSQGVAPAVVSVTLRNDAASSEPVAAP